MHLSPRFSNVLVSALIGSVFLAAAARADKINASYMAMQPQPFGPLTTATAADYNSTMFNRFLIMDLNFSSSFTPENPLVWGSGNVQPLSLPGWKASSPSAVEILKTLGAGKEVFATITTNSAAYLAGLSTAPLKPSARKCKAAPGSGNIHCAVFYLDQFVTSYGLAGIDIDIENSSPGFAKLVAALGDYSWPHQLSYAPFIDCDSSQGSCVAGGACVFQDAKLNGYGVGRQYHAGGHATDVAGLVATELKDAATLTCPSGAKLDLGSSSMIVGMSPYSVLGGCFPSQRGGPNNCHYYYDDPDSPDCFASVQQVVSQFPEVGGAYVWIIDLLDPHYYACCMDQVLNGHQNSCPDPQPIPADQQQGQNCPPVQYQNCSLKKAS